MPPKTFHELVAEQKPAVECQEMNPAYFFADPLDEEEPFGRSERAIAVSACQRCPIRRECLEYAMDTKQLYGVYGGYIPAQRETIRMRRELDAGNRTPDN